MDDFELDRPEFNGTLISLEFGPGGRIQQLWAADPRLPDEHEEFQFTLGPIQFGGEFADDYLPGTILLGARTGPNDPWILSRNTIAYRPEDAAERAGVVYEYEFSLLPDLKVTGRYLERPSPIPQVVWEINIANRGRRSVEIGELALPMALNNFYEGFGRSDAEVKRMYADRVHVHRFLGGAASYLYAQRLEPQSPGLLIFPGANTAWEFYTYVPASTTTGYRWEGIPIIYIHSRAAIEREGWPEWVNGHTSIVLEPGDARTYETRFATTDGVAPEEPLLTLAECGRPAMRLLPGAVAPAEVGIAVEVGGCAPKLFTTDVEAVLETDADEEGGFCFVRPAAPGPVRLSFQDGSGALSHAHLKFLAPIRSLIEKRASWIAEHQVLAGDDDKLDAAIWPVDIGHLVPLDDERDLANPATLLASVADAAFLAEKNAHYPDPLQVRLLEDYVWRFLRRRVQNPADASVGSVFGEGPVAMGFSRPPINAMTANLYHSLYRMALVAKTKKPARFYLTEAYRTARVLLDRAISLEWRRMGLQDIHGIAELIEDLEREGLALESADLDTSWQERCETLLDSDYPYSGELGWDASGLEEIASAARELSDEDHLQRAMRALFASRSLAPSWWWYGSEKRFISGGELCLGNTTSGGAVMFFDGLDRDYVELPEGIMRLAFGSMLGPWALVREDGAASMGFCPDAGSRGFGFSRSTGDIGRALYSYLRNAGSYVLPTSSGAFTFGCHFESDGGHYTVRPWDGIGRRIVIRQIAAEFDLRFGFISELKLDIRKRWAEVTIENPSPSAVKTELRARGLWGSSLQALGKNIDTMDGEAVVEIELAASSSTTLRLEVKE